MSDYIYMNMAMGGGKTAGSATDLAICQPPGSENFINIVVSGDASTTVAPSNDDFDGQDPPAGLVESWLPITESRKGNIFTAVFHILCSAIGSQSLLLPLTFTILGWAWGSIFMVVAFAWQFYTLWLLVHLHEASSGVRHSRFLRLSIAAFGAKVGKLVAMFPVMYLSGGSCVNLIITGGGALQQLIKTMCERDDAVLTGTESFVAFTCVAIALAQFPNLNSLAKLSFPGSLAAIAYLTLLWILSVVRGRSDTVSYSTSEMTKTGMAGYGNILFAMTVVLLSFIGHNVVLEIQGTLPSNAKHPSYKTMWRAAVISYAAIAMIFFPFAICGYWAYGNTLSKSGLLIAFIEIHGHETSKHVTGLIYLLQTINCSTSLQIYAMITFDNLEFIYVSKRKRRCSRWARAGIRCSYMAVALFVAMAVPFLPKLASLMGGLALALTFSYPCFMWNSIKRPPRRSPMWCLNLLLGCSGVVLSLLVIVGGAYNLARTGLKANFFNP